MYDYRRNFVCSDPAKRGPIMVINQLTGSTCNDASEFTDDDNFANNLEYNVNTTMSEIYKSNTRYGNLQPYPNVGILTY